MKGSMETNKTEILVCNLFCHGTLECHSFDDLLHSTDFIYKKNQSRNYVVIVIARKHSFRITCVIYSYNLLSISCKCIQMFQCSSKSLKIPKG